MNISTDEGIRVMTTYVIAESAELADIWADTGLARVALIPTRETDDGSTADFYVNFHFEVKAIGAAAVVEEEDGMMLDNLLSDVADMVEEEEAKGWGVSVCAVPSGWHVEDSCGGMTWIETDGLSYCVDRPVGRCGLKDAKAVREYLESSELLSAIGETMVESANELARWIIGDGFVMED